MASSRSIFGQMVELTHPQDKIVAEAHRCSVESSTQDVFGVGGYFKALIQENFDKTNAYRMAVGVEEIMTNVKHLSVLEPDVPGSRVRGTGRMVGGNGVQMEVVTLDESLSAVINPRGDDPKYAKVYLSDGERVRWLSSKSFDHDPNNLKDASDVPDPEKLFSSFLHIIKRGRDDMVVLLGLEGQPCDANRGFRECDVPDPTTPDTIGEIHGRGWYLLRNFCRRFGLFGECGEKSLYALQSKQEHEFTKTPFDPMEIHDYFARWRQSVNLSDEANAPSSAASNPGISPDEARS